METYITNMNNMLEQLNNTFDLAEERNSKLKYKNIEITEYEEERERKKTEPPVVNHLAHQHMNRIPRREQK